LLTELLVETLGWYGSDPLVKVSLLRSNFDREVENIRRNGIIESTQDIKRQMLRTKHQYSIQKPQKSTQRLEKEIISDNKPLRGGNLLLPHLNVQVQDDSK
jgi:hypothetical protein